MRKPFYADGPQVLEDLPAGTQETSGAQSGIIWDFSRAEEPLEAAYKLASILNVTFDLHRARIDLLLTLLEAAWEGVDADETARVQSWPRENLKPDLASIIKQTLNTAEREQWTK